MKGKLLVIASAAIVFAGLGSPNAALQSQESTKVLTVTSLAVSPSPSVADQTITITATVRPRDGGETQVPAGTVEFFDAAGLLGVAPLTKGDTEATASLTVTLIVGPHPLAANYKGDSRFQVSMSPPVLHMVNRQ